jgi:hypothetical protein
MDDVLPTVGSEAAEPVLEQQPFRPRKLLRRRWPRQARKEGRQPRRLAAEATELLGDRSLSAVQHHARRGQQQDTVGLGDPGGADEEHPAGPIAPGIGAGLGQRALDVIVHLGDITLRPLVQDHHVGEDVPTSPEALGAQH